MAAAWARMRSDRVAGTSTRPGAGSKKSRSRSTRRPPARARISARALSLPPDHISAYRSADPERSGDGSVADLLHAPTAQAAPGGALGPAAVRPRAGEAQHQPTADLARRMVARIDRVAALSHGRR